MSAMVANPLQKALRRFVAATLLLYLIVAGLSLYVYTQAHANGAALCALRNDLERRVISSRRFLEENPEGIPGLTPALLREGIENQQRTIDALSGLDCPPA